MQPAGELGLLAREERAEDADRGRRRRVVVDLAHELVRREALAGESVGAPERLRVDGEDLRHAALRARLLEPHPPGGQRGREADRGREVRRDGDDRRARLDPRPPRRRSRRRRPSSRSSAPAHRARRARRARSARRIGIELRAADDAERQTLLGREELVRPSRARDRPQPLQQRERVRRLREEAVREVRAEVLPRDLVADLAHEATRRT